jgi:hypothetical protein
MVRLQTLALVGGILLSTCVLSGQEFGGSPPWGLEKPVHFAGEVQRGKTFSQEIGGELSFDVTPSGEDWEIAVTGAGGADYSRCATPPYHGPNARDLLAWHFRGVHGSDPGGIGKERQIDFSLNSDDNDVTCRQMEGSLQGEGTFESRISGRCRFTPLSVKLSDGPPDQQTIIEMKFEGECALHGALELWRRPVTYTIPNGFTGWAGVCFEAKGQPALPRTGDRYRIVVGKRVPARTSSELRRDNRGARFEWSGGSPIPLNGPKQRIWGWVNGEGTCGPYQGFFVGTASQYRNHSAIPPWK